MRLYIQLPGFGEFHGFDLSDEAELTALPQEILGYFHKQSRKTIKHQLSSANTPKKLFRNIREMAEVDNEIEFKPERMFGGVAKLQIRSTFNELADMNFVDCGSCYFLALAGYFSRFPIIVFLWATQTEAQEAVIYRETVFAHCIISFGTPGITNADNDSGFTGDISGFRTDHNTVLKAVIPGRRQSIREMECAFPRNNRTQ